MTGDEIGLYRKLNMPEPTIKPRGKFRMWLDRIYLYLLHGKPDRLLIEVSSLKAVLLESNTLLKEQIMYLQCIDRTTHRLEEILDVVLADDAMEKAMEVDRATASESD